jgi:hypothetical protein
VVDGHRLLDIERASRQHQPLPHIVNVHHAQVDQFLVNGVLTDKLQARVNQLNIEYFGPVLTAAV